MPGRTGQKVQKAAKRAHSHTGNGDKFAALFKNMRQGVFYQAADGRLTDVNPAALKMLGVSRREFLSRNSSHPAWHIVREDGTPLPGPAHPSMVALRTGKPIKDFVLGLENNKSGETVWLAVNAIPEVRRGEKKPYRVAVTLHDLTAVKQAECALRDSRERFRSLFQHIREAVAVYEAVDGGKDFVFRDFNPAAEAIEQVRRDKLIGHRVTEVFPGVEEFGLLDVFRRVWTSGKTESFPARVYKDDHDPGTWRENEVYRIPGGEIVAVYRDVTEQVRADETLREDEERYRSLFESANDGIHLLRGGVFVDCNQRAVALFGGSDKSDLIGHRPAEFSPIRQPDGQESEAKARALIRATEEGAPQRFSWQHLRGDGSTFEAEVALNSLSLGGELFVQAIVRDVSERVRAEEEIRRSLREKETLLREIYHRTKNNMNVIASMLSLRARATAEPAAAAVCRDVQDRIRSMALVHQKLYESRDLSSIDLKDYIEALAANLVKSYGEQAAGLRIVPDLESVVVPIDIAIPCGMILNELFSNAFKHAFPGGRAGTIHLRLKRTERDEIMIVFSDDGARAPEGFDPRAQAGLGLRTLFMLVEHQLQGSVAFEAGAGLTCRIRFVAKPPGTETPA